MNENLSFQGPESNSQNPLAPSQDTDTSSVTKLPHLPINPKSRLLIILAIFIFLLLLTSQIISSLKNKPQNNIDVVPTITPYLIQTPSDIPKSNIPTEFREQFDLIDQYNQDEPTFDPPQIDTSIGK